MRPASMRENSSSELTSFSSRWALPRTMSSCSRAAAGSLLCASAASSGPSIRVRGVRNSWLTLEKKAVLAAVDLGQRLGTAALLVVRHRVADAAGDLCSQEFQERDVLRIERDLGAGGHDQYARRRMPEVEGQRHRLAQTGKVAELHALAAQCARERSGTWLEQFRGAAPGRHADLAHPPQPRPAALAEVDLGAGDVLAVLGQGGRGGLAGAVGALGLRDARGEFAQKRDAPLRDDLLGNLVHRGEHPADTVRRALIRHRTVGDGEVALLEVAVAVDLELDVLHPRGGAAVERLIDQRTDDVEDLAPAFAHRAAEVLRVLRAEHGAIGVVVDLDVLGPPPQEHREAVGEQQAHHHAQAHRPALRRPERRA